MVPTTTVGLPASDGWVYEPRCDGTLLDTAVVIYRDGRISFDVLQQRMSRAVHQRPD